jgi:hypothetical protein
MTARQVADAVLAHRQETELGPRPTAEDRKVWTAAVRDMGTDLRTAIWAARAHYENRFDEPLTPKAWIAAVRRVRATLDDRAAARPSVTPQEALALARIAAASGATRCPECDAAPGEPCTNPLTGRPFAGGWHFRRSVLPRRERVPA